MKKLLFLSLLPLAAFADTLNITYTPPTAREDGTPITAAEIANYRLVWVVKGSIQPDKLIPGGTSNSYTLNTGALSGKTCVTLYTVDSDGLESGPSSVACRNAKPNPPTELKVK